MLNKVMLIGRLGTDPEVRYLPTGVTVTTIALATSFNWKDKQTGERKETTEWHRVVFYKRLAEVAGEYLKKGSQVYIEGHLQTRKWQGQDGQDRYTTEIIASQMRMLGSRSGGTTAFDEQQSENGATAPSAKVNTPAAPPAQHANTIPPLPPTPPNYDDFDDDIPF